VAQFLRPDSNITQTSWTGGFADIDETTASDADYCYGANNSNSATLTVGLSDPSPPASGTCTVRWRHAKVSSGTLSGTGGTVQQTCTVLQGATTIASSTVTVGGSWTDGSFTFNVSGISNWTDVRLQWTQTASGGGANARGSAVSWAEIETPDAATAISLAANAGSFALTGQAISFILGFGIVAAAGSFALTGQSAGLVWQHVLTADSQSYALTGQDADLIFDPFELFDLQADPGQFGLTGQTVNLRREVITLPWLSSTAFAVGDIIRPSSTIGTGFYFRCIVAGTTATTEPFWPTFIGNEVADGGVTWKAVSIIAGQFQNLAPSSIIELFQLQLDATIHGSSETYYFHAGANLNNNSELIWAGQQYLRFPIEADGFEYSGQGTLPRPKIRISNIFGSITAILLSLPGGIESAKVTRIRTLARYLDDANFSGGSNPLGAPDSAAEFPREIYYIDRKSAENRDIVEFELAAVFDIAGIRAPKRQCIANICQWQYRSPECGYTGTTYFNASDQSVSSPSQDVCGKRLNSCRIRFGQNAELPYGSFPGIGSVAA
jgi:lambda family phage minor tail protein L